MNKAGYVKTKSASTQVDLIKRSDKTHSMTGNPKTIQIYLPNGDPGGIRIAEITTGIIQLIEVPRSLLPDFLTMTESKQVALYILFGESEDGIEKKIYVGQSGDLRARLKKHHTDNAKIFWQRALVLITHSKSLTQTHVLFLEWYCLQMARSANRYADVNGNSGNKPHTLAPLEADCLEIFEMGRTLLATLGYPIFDPVRHPSVATDKITPPASQEFASQPFFCKASGANGRGFYTPEGFVVLKGSTGRRQNTPSLGEAFERLRIRLQETGVTRVEGDRITFEKDHAFTSPTSAAVSLLGRRNNGWQEWKTAQGATLDEVYRQKIGS